jgi:hypothetical protein
MTQRAITWDEAHTCEVCKVEKVFTPATHSVTDAKQTAEGWQETAARYGCKNHKVTANVILVDGTVMPWETYRVN